MRNQNLVVLNGRLGSDIELKKTQSGKSVASVNIAVSFDKETTWITLVMWEKTAEIASKYCSKGSFIGVEGRLSNREWTDKEGNKKSRMEIVVTNLQLLDPPKKDESSQKEERINASFDDMPF